MTLVMTGIGLTGMGLALIAWPRPSLAHGVVLDAQPIEAFQVQARYDSGEPMANAQINVYSPTDPQTPWLQTLTDDQGYFLFTPDPAVAGTWDIQARLAGHGELLQVAVQENGTVSPIISSTHAPNQRWISIAAIVWGCIGTALFFVSKHNSQPTSSLEAPPARETHPPALQNTKL